MVASSQAPLLLLDRALAVVAASRSFCRAFHIDPAQVVGRSLFGLGAGEWKVPQLRSLLRATVAGHADIDAYEMDLRPPGAPPRRLVLNAQKLAYAGTEEVRILLAVADVTDARLAEHLRQQLAAEKIEILRHHAVLLQELQHRVANSLQIIASVLLQSARRVQSDETRTHLQAAHQRVMSVAALQRQLAISQTDLVQLRPYFVELCQSLSASMIRDPNQLSLDVQADDTSTQADISVSLGLIITELVINALKHAFPDDREGVISVAYTAHPAGWTLSVGDDGVGMRAKSPAAQPGLGTSIVAALAKKLQAHVVISDRNPGTTISIICDTAAPQNLGNTMSAPPAI